MTDQGQGSQNGQQSRESFVVGLAEAVLGALRKVSYFHWVCRVVPETFFFVDIWVLAWLTASVSFFAISFCTDSAIIVGILAVVAALSAVRVFECVIYLTNVMIFPRANKGEYDIFSPQRSIILLICNYVEIIFWFAFWFSLLRRTGRLVVDAPFVPIAILRESLALMVANWTGAFTKMTRLTWVVITLQNFVGLFMTITIVARFISQLPQPTYAKPTAANPTSNFVARGS